jgi:DNA-binding Xre family transcriptional regulator
MMYITLGAYLERLEAVERAKPEGARRDVPTMRELAEAAGISPVSLSRLVTGKVGSLNFKIARAILDELHRRGFDANINDILEYAPPEELREPA